jgi:sarcosine oxidase subunit beta
MTRVIRLVADAARVRAVVTSEEDRIEVDSAVVVLANQGVAELVATLGARLGGTREQRDRAAGGTERRLASPGPASLATFPVWPQVLVTQPLARAVVHHLIGHSHRRLALKSLPDGSLMITGGWLGVWNSERGVGEPVAEAVAGNLAEAIAVFPCLAGTDVRWAVADRLESVSSDLVPIIDAVPGVTNCLFATGWSGHGWAIAPAVTELMATWLLEGDRPATLAPFALSRPALRS